jgi:diguanylate cyclase (GGDEF)-like protein
VFTSLSIFSLNIFNKLTIQLSDISEKSIPELSISTSLNTKMQMLATHTNLLGTSKNESARSLAMREITKISLQINEKLEENTWIEGFLVKQLATVFIEINELDNLVSQKHKQDKLLEKDIDKLYRDILQTLELIDNSTPVIQLKNQLFGILVLSLQINDQRRLHELRNIERQLISKFDELQGYIGMQKATENIKSIHIGLLGERGIMSKKIELLKLSGRSQGRSSFVRNLIMDAASNTAYKDQIIKTQTLKFSENISNESQGYIVKLVIGLVISVILTLFMVYLLYRRIVSRLVLLSKEVKAVSLSELSTHEKLIITVSGKDEITELAISFLDFLKRIVKNENELLRLSLTDSLTSIPNRRALNNYFEKEINTSNSYQGKASLMLFDVDFFKAYNDFYGHLQGDECLIRIASILYDLSKKHDGFCARFGGEEFAIILPNTSIDEAKIKAEDYRIAIENANIEHSKSAVAKHVTISIGCATFDINSHRTLDFAFILEKADEMLYQAKDQGRNAWRIVSLP